MNEKLLVVSLLLTDGGQRRHFSIQSMRWFSTLFKVSQFLKASLTRYLRMRSDAKYVTLYTHVIILNNLNTIKCMQMSIPQIRLNCDLNDCHMLIRD